MVSAWKESGKLKDLKIEELNFQLGQAAAQLAAARQEAAALQQQLADSSTQVCEGLEGSSRGFGIAGGGRSRRGSVHLVVILR